MFVFPSAFSLAHACRERGERNQRGEWLYVTELSPDCGTGAAGQADAGSHDGLCKEQVLSPVNKCKVSRCGAQLSRFRNAS